MKCIVSVVVVLLSAGTAFAGPHSFEVRGEVLSLGKDVRATIELPSKERCAAARRIATASDVRDVVARAAVSECAPATPVPDPVCLPPGVPQGVFSWPVVDVSGAMVPTDTGRAVPFIRVVHERGGKKVVLGYAEGRLTYVDTSPDDPEAPVMLNRNEVAEGEKGALLDKPRGGACSWRSPKESTT